MSGKHVSNFCFVFFSVALLLISCSSGRLLYRYKNVEYESQEAALDAQEKDLHSIVLHVTPTKTPVGGSMRVFIPSISYMKAHFPTRWTNMNPSEEQEKRANNFLAATLTVTLRQRVLALDKRKIFDNVVVTISDNPLTTAFNEDFAMTFAKKADKMEWLLIKRGGNFSDATVIKEKNADLPSLLRWILWLDEVERAARRQ